MRKIHSIILVVLLSSIAATAQSTGLSERGVVVLECAAVSFPGGGPPPQPPPEPPALLVIAVTGTPGVPDIVVGQECGLAIGALVNDRFLLHSATPTSPTVPGLGPTPDLLTELSSVQYLFVSKPGMGNR